MDAGGRTASLADIMKPLDLPSLPASLEVAGLTWEKL
jgi:hypothetical protein